MSKSRVSFFLSAVCFGDDADRGLFYQPPPIQPHHARAPTPPTRSAKQLRTTGYELRCTGPRPGLRGRFLHLTDMHPDPHYRKGGSQSSACHRAKPKKEKQRGGMYGLDYGCVGVFGYLLLPLLRVVCQADFALFLSFAIAIAIALAVS